MITRRDVAERWSYSIETIKRLERAGTLPVFKVRGEERFGIADIELIEKQALVHSAEGIR
jgi:hypothetical protein